MSKDWLEFLIGIFDHPEIMKRCQHDSLLAKARALFYSNASFYTRDVAIERIVKLLATYSDMATSCRLSDKT